MLGCRLPRMPGTTPAPRYADDWLTSEESSVDSRPCLKLLTLPRHVAVMQRGEDTAQRVQAGEDVDHRDAHFGRRTRFGSGDAHQATDGLYQQVVAGQLGALAGPRNPVMAQ